MCCRYWSQKQISCGNEGLFDHGGGGEKESQSFGQVRIVKFQSLKQLHFRGDIEKLWKQAFLQMHLYFSEWSARTAMRVHPPVTVHFWVE